MISEAREEEILGLFPLVDPLTRVREKTHTVRSNPILRLQYLRFPNHTSNMKSLSPTFKSTPSNSRTIPGSVASGVVPVCDFVESLTIFVAAVGGRKDTEVAGRAHACVGSKQIQYGKWKPSTLSLLLTVLGGGGLSGLVVVSKDLILR